MADRSRLYQYAIIHHPAPEKTDEKPDPSVVLVEPTFVLARDDQGALIQASRAIPEDFLGVLEEVEIAVRPF